MLGDFFKRKIAKAKCFALGLETITEKGLKDLDDLRVGDNLLGFDYEGDGGDALNKVEDVRKITAHGTYYCINEKVLLFENQSIVANGNVTHAKLLKVGDKLVGLGGREVLVSSITKVKGRYTFYNLKVRTNHTYFLNGILMHNASRFWVGGSGTFATSSHWSASTGGAGGASVPTSADDVFMDANSGSATVTNSVTPACRSIDLTGFTGAWTASSTQNLDCYGSFNCGTTVLTVNVINFRATTTGWTINFNGTTQSFSNANDGSPGIWFVGVGGGWTLNDDLNNSNGAAVEVDAGTFNGNNKNVSAQGFCVDGSSSTRVVNMGSGTYTLRGAGGFGTNGWGTNGTSVTTGLTFNANTSTIKMTGVGAFRTFAGAGLTYNNIWISVGTDTNVTYFQGGFGATINQLKDDSTGTHGLYFNAGKTFTIADWQVSGITSHLITITSCTDSSQTTSTATHSLVYSGGTVVSADFLAISHSVATPGSTWYAGTHSTNSQATSTAGSGWIFTAPPSGVFLPKRRSTQAINRAAVY